MDVGLLIARLVLGLGLASHGAQKLFGWFGGSGPDGTRLFLARLGFPPTRSMAVTAGLGEFCGGCLLALGFLGAIGPALMIAVMMVAIGSVHIRNGFFNDAHGMELPLLYAVGAMTIAVVGPGRFALDAVLGLVSLWTQPFVWGSIVIAIVLSVLTLTLRHPQFEPSTGSHATGRR